MTYRDETRWVLQTIEFEVDDYPQEYRDIAWLLSARGISPDASTEFLNPTLTLPDPYLMHGVETAATQIIDAAKAGQKIVIHGDFDADGICATTLLWEFLYRELAEHLGIQIDVVPYIPSRVDEGYGLSEASIQAMIDLGAYLIITVDCGVRDKALIEKSRSDKLDFIVTDHHQPPDDLGEDLKYTIVHQKFPGSEFPYREISGTAVAYILCEGLRKMCGIGSNLNPVDLVAISTVTDVMPMIGLNRNIVAEGLNNINQSKRAGLLELIRIAEIKSDILDTYSIGFQIGPRINAAGRIGDALDGVRLLSTQDPQVGKKYASKLHQLNVTRQEMTKRYLDDAMLQASRQKDRKINIITGEDWPEGIIGLVAGKLHEASNLPTLVISVKDGVAKGSARSVEQFNITDALATCSDILIKYGGHAQAAGFTLHESDLDTFAERLNLHVDANLTFEALIKEISIDMEISVDQIGIDFVKKLDLLKPYGNGNPKPIFLISGCTILEKTLMGRDGNHMKLIVGSGENRVNALLFDCVEDINQLSVRDSIDLIGQLNINSWNNVDSVQLIVKGWRPSK